MDMVKVHMVTRKYQNDFVYKRFIDLMCCHVREDLFTFQEIRDGVALAELILKGNEPIQDKTKKFAPKEMRPKVEELIKKGRFIKAIQYVHRNNSKGWGLSQSKEFVDGIRMEK